MPNPALMNLLQCLIDTEADCLKHDTVIIREPWACIPLDKNTVLCYNVDGAAALTPTVLAADVRSALYG